MVATSDFIISKEVLNSAHLSAEELSIEIATHLYATERLTMGQATRLAGIDRLSFQHELARRNIYLHITIDDVMKDVETLRNLC